MEAPQSREEEIVVDVKGVFRYKRTCDLERFYIVWREKKRSAAIVRSLSFSRPRLPFLDAREIMECIDDLQRNFNDLQSRQICYSSLKSKLVEVRDVCDVRNDNMVLLLNMILDAVSSIKSERITIDQIGAIRSAIMEANRSITRNEVLAVQTRLFQAGFKPVPKLEGIAELYEL